MQLVQKVTRRLKLGQKLRQTSEDSEAVAAALVAALREKPVIAASALHELVTTVPLALNDVLVALSEHQPSWLFGTPTGWHQSLDDTVALHPKPESIEPAVLREPLRTAASFALWRRGIAPRQPLDAQVLEAIAENLLAPPRVDPFGSKQVPDRRFERSAEWVAALHRAAARVERIADTIPLAPLFETVDDAHLVELLEKCEEDRNDLVLRHVLGRPGLVDLLVQACVREPAPVVPTLLSVIGSALVYVLSKAGRSLPDELSDWGGVNEAVLELLPRDQTAARLVEALQRGDFVPLTTLARFPSEAVCAQLAASLRKNENALAHGPLELLATMGPAGLAQVRSFFERPVFWVRREEFIRLLPIDDALHFAAQQVGLRKAFVESLPTRTDDEYFRAIEVLELSGAQKVRLLAKRVWSPRAVELAATIVEPSPERDRLLAWPDDLKALWTTPTLEPVRAFARERKGLVAGIEEDRLVSWPLCSELLAVPEGRLAFVFWFDLSSVLTTARVPEAARTPLAEVIIRRLRQGVSPERHRRLASFLLELPPTEAAFEQVRDTRELHQQAHGWFEALLRQGSPLAIEWVRRALRSEPGGGRAFRQALELATAVPGPFVEDLKRLAGLSGEAAVVAASALTALDSGGASSALKRALAQWRESRSGALGDALLAAAEPSSVPARERIRAATERGFDRVWHEEQSHTRALAETVTRQEEPVSSLVQRLRRLIAHEPHPAIARVVARVLESGLLDQPRTSKDWVELCDALVTDGDERSLDSLERWCGGEVKFTSPAIREALSKRGSEWCAALRARVRPAANVHDLLAELSALPRAVDASTASPPLASTFDWSAPHVRAVLEKWPPPPAQMLVLADQLRERGDGRAPLLEAFAAGDTAAVQKLLRLHATSWAGPLTLIARRADLGFHPTGVVTHLLVDKSAFKQPFFDAIESDALATVTHLALTDRHPKTWKRALVSAAANHRLQVLVTRDASVVPEALDRTRVRVVTTFDRSAFFGRCLSLSS